MKSYAPIVKWSRQHHKKVADYWQSVAKYEAKFRKDPITWVIGQYIQSNRIPIHELSDCLSAKKEAMFNCIKDTPIDKLDGYRAKLVEKYGKINDVEKKSKLEEKIEWLAYFIFCGESMPGKPLPKEFPAMYQLGEELYELLRGYLIEERLKLEPWTSVESNEFNFRSELDYQIESKGGEGFEGDKLVEKVVSQILANWRNQHLASIPIGKLQGGFKRYVSSQTTQEI